jgi:DedD protein
MSGAIKVPQGSASKSAAAASKPEAPPPPIAGLPPEPAPAPGVKAAAKAPEPKAAPADTKDTAKTAAKEPASPMAGAYVVQVAALADSGKAKQLEKQMADTGLKTYTEVVNTQSGEVTRVRAGPFATREAAEKARAQLKKAGMDGTVLPK